MIAICLSVYNGSQFLEEQLISLQNQTYNHQDMMLIARDDGSQDNSYAILKKFSAYSDIQIKCLNDCTNLGIKKSFELLMREAVKMGAEYIMFCDQDDVWKNNKIVVTYAKMKQMENLFGKSIPLLVHSDLKVVDDRLNLINSSFWKYQNIDPYANSLNRLLLQNTATGCTLMINSTLAQKVGNIPQEAVMHDWWIVMVASVFGKIGTINNATILYRQHSLNDTGAKKYDIKYVINHFVKNQNLDKYQLQARIFLNIYEKKMDQKTKNMLESFSNMDKMNWYNKRIFLLQNHIFKHGFLRNIGLFIKI